MENPDLHARLLEEARRYDPAQHTRSLLSPYRDVLLLQRAKYMSYEQVAATLTRHGLKVSAAAVGCFCRRNFTRVEIEAARAGLDPRKSVGPVAPVAQGGTAVSRAAVKPVALPVRDAGRRGPKIARDDF